MRIDPYTLLAQLLNFLLLAALLSRFVYRPVLGAMDRRDKGLAERLADLETREQSCVRRQEQLAQQALELEQRHQQARAEVAQEVQQLRAQEIERARLEVAEQRRHWEAKLRQDFEDLSSQRSQELAELMLEIVRRALGDLADQALDERIILHLLKELPSEVSLQEPVAVTARPLSEESRRRLAEAFPGLRFEESPQLLGGVVLKDGQHRLAWSIESYLEGLAAC